MRIKNNTEQQYSSSSTSINCAKVPAVFKKVNWIPNTVNFDNGGGKFDTATDYLREFGIDNLIYDKYNRSNAHNNMIENKLSNKLADTSTISNVLNVVAERSVRIEILKNSKNAIKMDGEVYITVYEGDKTGTGKKTTKGYQLNRKLRDYIEEVSEVFENVTVKNGMIIAKNF